MSTFQDARASSPFRSSFDASMPASQSPFGEVARRADFASSSSAGAVSDQREDRATAVNWEAHAAMPLIITGYIQAAFNLIIFCGLLFAVYSFTCAIQQDIDLRAEHFRREVLSEIKSCALDYEANRCEPNERIPAMQKMCEGWKNCMQQDPLRVARGKITAHTIAEIFNSFVEPISYKTMIFVALILVTVIVGSNIGFGIGRRSMASVGSGDHSGGREVVMYKKKKR
jgi:hypothetical protein